MSDFRTKEQGRTPRPVSGFAKRYKNALFCNHGHEKTPDNRDPRGRCKICNRRRAYTWKAKNLDKVREYSNATKGRRAYHAKKYGLTPEQYEDMARAQNYLCAVCNEPELKKRYLSIDHDHKMEKVRALLCDRCNVGLGSFRDDPLRLQAAADYLRRFSEEEILSVTTAEREV